MGLNERIETARAWTHSNCVGTALYVAGITPRPAIISGYTFSEYTAPLKPVNKLSDADLIAFCDPKFQKLCAHLVFIDGDTAMHRNGINAPFQEESVRELLTRFECFDKRLYGLKRRKPDYTGIPGRIADHVKGINTIGTMLYISGVVPSEDNVSERAFKRIMTTELQQVSVDDCVLVGCFRESPQANDFSKLVNLLVRLPDGTLVHLGKSGRIQEETMAYLDQHEGPIGFFAKK